MKIYTQGAAGDFGEGNDGASGAKEVSRERWICYTQQMNKGNDHLTVKRAATGLGLFARRAIAADKRIVEFTGPLITTEERYKIGGRYLFELDEKRAIDGKSRRNIARYINHSCRPNAIAYITGRRIWIWSRRAIEAGEEITIDYGKEYFDQFIRPLGCKCEKCASKANAKTRKKKTAG